MATHPYSRRSAVAFTLIVVSTVLGMAGIDLVLPAVPSLPQVLGGSYAQAQLVLAAFVAGAAVGLLLFGTLGALFDQRRLLAASLAVYGVVSVLAGISVSIEMLIGLRFVQGAAGSAAAVFAPGMIRALYGDDRAVAALGLFGSIESLTPALAPIAGVWLLAVAGWTASFHLLALLSFGAALAVTLLSGHLPPLITRRGAGGYARLLVDPTFLRYALSHAFTLGGLLVIVFGAPTVFLAALGAGLGDFILMQVTGIATFIVAANAAGRLTRRFGAEALIWFGTAVSAAGGLLMLIYAVLGGADTLVVTALFVPFNTGLGLRGPPGFHRAVVAAHGDDARGSALVVVAILVVSALGTAAVAPFITQGLVPVALVAGAFAIGALALLALLPALAEDRAGAARITPPSHGP